MNKKDKKGISLLKQINNYNNTITLQCFNV